MTVEDISATGELVRWMPATGKGAWYFITITGQAADDIRISAMMGPWLARRPGFGSVRVAVQLGTSQWNTSLFPHKQSGGWLLPVKAAIRRAESLDEGDEVSFTIRL